MLDRIIRLVGFIAGELDNAMGLFQSVLGDQAEGLARFFGLWRVRINAVKDFVEVTDQSLGFRRTGRFTAADTVLLRFTR